jgi:hypothetical protein
MPSAGAGTPSGPPGTVGVTGALDRTAAAAVAAIVRTVAVVVPSGVGVTVHDRGPTTGCRQPGEPFAALGLPPGGFVCGAVPAGGPPVLSATAHAAIIRGLAGRRVAFVPVDGAQPPVPAGSVGVGVDRVIVTGSAARVSVLCRGRSDVPATVRWVRLAFVAGSATSGGWRVVG